MKRLLPGLAAVTALVCCGVVHGLWTDRWVGQEELSSALERLRSLPQEIGDWRGEDVKPPAQRGEEAMVSMSRRYVHRGTGAAVTVFLAGGRPGPVSVHTPDVCYAASGYEVSVPTRYSVPAAGERPEAEFWTAQLVKTKATQQSRLRIFWSWNAGNTWMVADNPRLTFSGERRLYKLYLIREVTRLGEPLERDPCVTFLPSLLPELQKGLFSKS